LDVFLYLYYGNASKLRKRLFISTCILIISISLVSLVDHPSGSSRRDAGETCHKTLKVTDDLQGIENSNDFDPWEWETSAQGCILPQPYGILFGQEPVLSAIILQQVLLNPSLVDLPPPAILS